MTMPRGMMGHSPALSISSDLSDEELDRYFASYVPLSNLPTPPPAKSVTTLQALKASTEVTHARTPELEAHAIHLAKLIPSNLSTQPTSIPTISEFLSRASLPIEIIAFTACILDALSHRFASSWRAANLASAVVPSRFAPLAVNLRQPPPVSAEVVVLAALTLAHGWLEDGPRSLAHWASIEGGGNFTSKELEISRVCILRDVDYGLFRVTEDMVRRMVRDLQRTASSNSVGLVAKNGAASAEGKRKPKLSLDMQGTAFWMYGMVTPEPSP